MLHFLCVCARARASVRPWCVRLRMRVCLRVLGAAHPVARAKCKEHSKGVFPDFDGNIRPKLACAQEGAKVLVEVFSCAGEQRMFDVEVEASERTLLEHDNNYR